jgi:hypothetical protein
VNPLDDPEELTALYLAGALEPEERTWVEARLSDGEPALRAALAALLPGIDALVDALPPIEPPTGIRDALVKMARQSAVTGSTPSAHVEEVEIQTVSQGLWRPTTSRGVTFRPLYSDKANGAETFLLRMEPGSILKPHAHGIDGEECYMIEGDALSAGYALHAGDYQRLPHGLHGPVSTRGGCLILVRVSHP